ncbi:MAG: hypothetical protein AB1689_27465 [Thermodesulfobacteriota bacterium]
MRRGAHAVPFPATGQVASAASAWIALAALLGMAITAAGCQAKREQEAPENLEARARQYLELKQKRDWAAIYDGLLDPELRKTLKREVFLRKRSAAFDVLGYTLVSTKEEGETGKVLAKLDAMIPVINPRGGTTMLRKEVEEPQKWVSRDGRWYIQLAS